MKPLFLRAVRTVAWNAVRGCGCRCRAARQATIERRCGRRGPARALPSRSAGMIVGFGQVNACLGTLRERSLRRSSSEFGSKGARSRKGRPMALWQASAERGGSRGAPAGAGRAGCDARFEVPRSFLSTLRAGFFQLARTGLETTLFAGRPHRGVKSRPRRWMSLAGSSSIRP